MLETVLSVGYGIQDKGVRRHEFARSPSFGKADHPGTDSILGNMLVMTTI